MTNQIFEPEKEIGDKINLIKTGRATLDTIFLAIDDVTQAALNKYGPLGNIVQDIEWLNSVFEAESFSREDVEGILHFVALVHAGHVDKFVAEKKHQSSASSEIEMLDDFPLVAKLGLPPLTFQPPTN